MEPPFPAKRAVKISTSLPVGVVSGAYSSGRRAVIQRRPVGSSKSLGSRVAVTVASLATDVSARVRPKVSMIMALPVRTFAVDDPVGIENLVTAVLGINL